MQYNDMKTRTFTVDEMLQFAISVQDGLFKPTENGLSKFISMSRSSLLSQPQAKNRSIKDMTVKCD